MFTKPSSCLGVGINFLNEISDDIIKNIDQIDFVEVNTERFFNDSKNVNLEKIIATVPLVLHGLSLSIGTSGEVINNDYIKKLSETLSITDCRWFSEHIAVTNVNGVEIRSLMPVGFDEESIDSIVRKARQIKALTNKPFLLENITYYYSMPTSHLKESYFISEIVSRADCGLLLDVNNLYVNSVNHGYDPYEFLNEIPLDRVVEVHLAGCDYMHDMLIDTHASSIKREVLSIFEYVCTKSKVNGVVIERDDKLGKFSDILKEIETVREILSKSNNFRS